MTTHPTAKAAKAAMEAIYLEHGFSGMLAALSGVLENILASTDAGEEPAVDDLRARALSLNEELIRHI